VTLVISNCSTTLGWFGGTKFGALDGRIRVAHRYIKPGDVLVVREDLATLHPELVKEDPRIAVMTSVGHVGWLFADEVDSIQEENNDEIHQASSHVRGQERSQDPLGGADPEADR
jgi:hypothetical protein